MLHLVVLAQYAAPVVRWMFVISCYSCFVDAGEGFSTHEARVLLELQQEAQASLVTQLTPGLARTEISVGLAVALTSEEESSPSGN